MAVDRASQSENPPGLSDPVTAEPPLAAQIVRGGAAVALSSYFLFAFGFIANLFLTRILAPADFGILALGTFFFSLINLRPKIGIDQAFTQHTASDAEASGTFAAMSIAAGMSSLVIALIAVPVLFALGYSAAVVTAVLVLASVGLVDSVMGIAWVQLDKSLLFARVSLVTAIAFPLSYLPAFSLALNGGGFWALLAQNASYAVLLCIGLWVVARRALPGVWSSRWRFSGMLARQFLRFGIFVGLATIFATIVFQFDNFLVGTIVGVDALGYYDRAYRIAQWSFILVGSVLTRTVFYAYSRLQNDVARLTRLASMSIWIVTTLAVPIALAIFVAADDLVLVLFGPRWLPSALLLRFLVVYAVLRPLLEDASFLFIAVGKPRRTTVVTVIQAAAIVAAATPLTLLYGAVGTAVGVGISFVVGLGVCYWFVRQTLPALALRAVFLVPVVSSLITLLVTLPLAVWLHTLDAAAPVVMVIELVATAAVYLGVTFILRPRLTRERAIYLWQLLRHGVPASQDPPVSV